MEFGPPKSAAGVSTVALPAVAVAALRPYPGPLGEWVRPWREKYPRLPVRVYLTRDEPAAALLTSAATAELLVVGSR